MGNILPKNWVHLNLKESVDFRKGKKPKTLAEEYFEGSVPYMDIQALEKDYITFYADSNSAKYFKNNDVVIVWDGSRSGLILKSKSGAIGSTLGALSPIGYDNQYLYYFLLSHYETINSKARGVGIPHVDPTYLWNLDVPLPPLAEQERIVAKLDALFAQQEKMKHALDKIPQLLKDFRQQVLTQAVTGKLTEQWRKGKKLEKAEILIENIINDRNQNDTSLKKKINYKPITGTYDIPNEWSFSFLQNFGEFTRGKSKHRPRNDKKLFGGKYPFIQTGDVSNANMYINEFKNTYSEFGLNQSRLFPKGTLCITIAANIAETAILNFDSCFPDSVVGYIPYKNLYTSEFAMYFINNIQKELEQYAPATAQKNINMAILTEIPFPIPPLEEQQEIVSRVKSLFIKADAIETQYQTLKTKIDSLPQAILHKAFKGELVAQLPTDGDAKDLLAEIIKLKEEAKPNKGKKK
ncbi:restriction endonuclease subunit S [Myroides odoratimimus]|uniref:restriction endonuclease subunit S n=1 Tax=Myroides odoratimimus TaxID=76832 RepID=UPI002578B571|nr:restriction endonuclease subunit S [Myroides odoratimimus]MDM1518030.1 restriction endonuclease subunit S [Myroides odoratimimus]